LNALLPRRQGRNPVENSHKTAHPQFMPKKDPRVDAYIEKAGDFTKPMLNRFRKLVHKACPEVEEDIKWSSPFFMYKGMFAAMMGFKEHCAFIFPGSGELILGKEEERFRRLTSAADLPADSVLLGYIRKAVDLKDAGIKRPRPKAKKELVVPDYFLAAVKKNKKALAAFEAFSPSHKREYVEWVAQAKQEETRARRLKSAIEMMSKGKSRNWKYQ
jgi:uncharacterized protein YdeI (YjbR/CyaY-like superfamily)